MSVSPCLWLFMMSEKSRNWGEGTAGETMCEKDDQTVSVVTSERAQQHLDLAVDEMEIMDIRNQRDSLIREITIPVEHKPSKIHSASRRAEEALARGESSATAPIAPRRTI